ncbi:MAG TPA: hypothetical protein VM283_09235 [Armatimonadota bacterium]|nr:hypothetical protein [Armatimonadota bacterium]
MKHLSPPAVCIAEQTRRCESVPITLCLETPEMWAVLGQRIGQQPGHYVCNCGPDSTPGAPMYDRMTGRCASCSI